MLMPITNGCVPLVGERCDMNKHWDKPYTLTEEDKRKIQLELAIDRLCRLREERKNIDLRIKDVKNEIRQISPDNVYLDI